MSAPPDFVLLQGLYPNIGNEAFAFKAWIGALVAEQNDAMKILEGTKRWAAWWLDEGTSPAYIPTLAKFLGDRRYRIDPGPGGCRSRGTSKKVWLGSPQPSELRWTANRINDPKITKPLSVAPYEPEKPREGFRPAAEILASRRST